MKFKNKFMQSVVYEENVDVVVLEDNIVETSRWSEIHVMTFSYKDKFYQSSYSRGLTEMQDESPYEYDGDEIDCTEVHKVEKLVKVWEPVK